MRKADNMTQALLVVDAQVSMFEGDWPVYAAEETLTCLEALVAYARAVGMPVIFVQHNSGADDIFFPGTPGWEIAPRLAPQTGEAVVQKTTGNAFFETDLAQQLAAHDVDALLICGMQSDECINATVRGAVALGYPVTLISDAHSTIDGDLPAAEQIAAINDSLGAIATLVTAESILNS